MAAGKLGEWKNKPGSTPQRQRYIAEFNSKFTVPARDKGTAFRKSSRADLEWIFTVQTERVVAKDNTVAIGDQHWQLEKSRFRSSLAGCTVTIHEHLDGAVSIRYGPHVVGRFPAAAPPVEPESRGKAGSAETSDDSSFSLTNKNKKCTICIHFPCVRTSPPEWKLYYDADIMTRRELGKGAVAATLAAAGQAATLEKRKLGKTGAEVSLLGIGSSPVGEPDVTQQEVDRLMASAIGEGINYIDTAPIYGLAEIRLGHALKGRRKQVFLVSKVEATSRQDAAWQLEESLRKLQTDYLDAVHIHNVGRTDRFPSLEVLLGPDGALQALRDAKKKGQIRHIGLTCHLRPGRALPVIETGDIELVMCAANFVDLHTYNFEGTVFEAARIRGLGIVAMKVLGGAEGNGAGQKGKLAPEHYEAAMRYAFGIPGLSVGIVGMRRMSDLTSALASVRSHKPFTPEELTRLSGRGKQMARQWGELRGPVA